MHALRQQLSLNSIPVDRSHPFGLTSGNLFIYGSFLTGSAWIFLGWMTYSIFSRFLLAPLLLAALVGIVWCLRQTGYRWLACALLAGTFCGAVLGFATAEIKRDEVRAVELGYSGARAKNDAARLGFTNAAQYNVHIRAKAEDAKRAADQKAVEDAQIAAETMRLVDLLCRESADCYGNKFYRQATAACEAMVQRSAKYDFKWTNGWDESKFEYRKWGDQERGTIVYAGDRLQLQNGFGNWIVHRYACEFDPARNAIVYFNLEAGRI